MKSKMDRKLGSDLNLTKRGHSLCEANNFELKIVLPIIVASVCHM